MSKRKLAAPLLLTALAVSACANKSDQIAAAYVSPNLYQQMSCPALAAEAQSVSNRAHAASAAQDKKASDDAVATGIGMVLFWPALFMVKGDGAGAAEVARLKGEMQAIEHANRVRNCNIRFGGATVG